MRNFHSALTHEVRVRCRAPAGVPRKPGWPQRKLIAELNGVTRLPSPAGATTAPTSSPRQGRPRTTFTQPRQRRPQHLHPVSRQGRCSTFTQPRPQGGDHTTFTQPRQGRCSAKPRARALGMAGPNKKSPVRAMQDPSNWGLQEYLPLQGLANLRPVSGLCALG